MHQKYLTIFILLSSVNAVSLTDFQPMPSIPASISCKFTYESQIPSCIATEFRDGCSSQCQSALNAVGRSIASTCQGVSATSTSLLGVVLSGGIIPALCPTVVKGTTTAPAAAKSTSSSNTVSTQTTASSAASAVSQSTVAPSSAAQSQSTTSEAAATTPAAETSPSAASQESTSHSSASAKSTGKSNPKTDSGGGSPFDIQSSADRVDRGSALCALVVAVWAGVLLRR